MWKGDGFENSGNLQEGCSAELSGLISVGRKLKIVERTVSFKYFTVMVMKLLSQS